MKISFIMLCYNQTKSIRRAINSVLFSSIPKDDYEIIVVDDGSTDNSCETILDMDNTVLIPMGRNTRNQALCRNSAIRKAKGKYIRFLDGDDYFNSNNLYREYLKLDDCDIHFSDRITRRAREEDGNKITKVNYNDFIFDGIGNYYVKKQYLFDNNIMYHEEKYNWYSEDIYFFVTMYDKTNNTDFLNEGWTYYCIKYDGSNSDLSMLSYEELMWRMEYYSDMQNDIMKIVKTDKAKNLLERIMDNNISEILSMFRGVK